MNDGESLFLQRHRRVGPGCHGEKEIGALSALTAKTRLADGDLAACLSMRD